MSTTPSISEQGKMLVSHIAGYVGHRTIGIGLRTGLVGALADRPEGTSPEYLAAALKLDDLYVSVWCRSALAVGVCERTDNGYRLARHMDTLLLDRSSPAYVGGTFTVFEQHELFDRFESVLPSGERLWWDQTSPEWIAGVAGTGTPFYTRLVPDGLAQVPGLVERLDAGCLIVDTACGAGNGIIRLAEYYPTCELIGVDGDGHSIELARKRVAEMGLEERVRFVVSPLEDMRLDDHATLVVNNISMHECRDIDRVTTNVRDALEPGGWFVISDFPFPDSDEGLATAPGRVMAGIQFFEAQIDDQLLPRKAYDELLHRHGFSDLGTVEITPMHALTWGRAA